MDTVSLNLLQLLPNLVTVSDGFGAKFGSSMSDGVNSTCTRGG